MQKSFPHPPTPSSPKMHTRPLYVLEETHSICSLCIEIVSKNKNNHDKCFVTKYTNIIVVVFSGAWKLILPTSQSITTEASTLGGENLHNKHARLFVGVLLPKLENNYSPWGCQVWVWGLVLYQFHSDGTMRKSHC